MRKSFIEALDKFMTSQGFEYVAEEGDNDMLPYRRTYVNQRTKTALAVEDLEDPSDFLEACDADGGEVEAASETS